MATLLPPIKSTTGILLPTRMHSYMELLPNETLRQYEISKKEYCHIILVWKKNIHYYHLIIIILYYSLGNKNKN